MELYSGFLNIIQRLMAGENENVPVEPLKPDEMLMFLLDFKTEIILWSSPGVINVYREFEGCNFGDEGINETFPLVDALYREMRKDIGLSNQGLPANQLVKMYLSDPNELDEALANAASKK